MQSVLCPPGIKKTTLYNGCTIAYSDDGDGDETLLFIHGLGTYGGTWDKNISVLCKHYRCIAIDLPGNGCSDTGDYPYSMDFFAHAIIDFIGRMKLHNVTLVGHSMGGQIAVAASLLLPACCKGLILCAPAGFETFSAHERMMFKASMDYMSWLTSNEQSIQHLIHSGFYRMPKDAAHLQHTLIDIARRQPAHHYKKMTDRCIKAMMGEPVAGKLHLVTQPVLVLFGEQDALIPNTLLHHTTTKKIAEASVRKLKHGTLHMLRGCGHFVQWECATKVNARIRTWMKAVSA